MKDNLSWASEWFSKGNRDIKAGVILLESSEPLFDMVCFHAQQCAEKYLKGFLCFHDVVFPKTHDLDRILVQCKEVDPSYKWLERHCNILSEYAVTIRYPDDLYQPDKAEARQAITLAIEVKSFVLDKLPLENAP